METIKMESTKKTGTVKSPNGRSKRTPRSSDASGLLHEGKKLAGELYEEGLNAVNQVEENLKEYSDEILKKVQKNPMTSLLVAGGIGFLLSTLLKK